MTEIKKMVYIKTDGKYFYIQWRYNYLFSKRYFLKNNKNKIRKFLSLDDVFHNLRSGVLGTRNYEISGPETYLYK